MALIVNHISASNRIQHSDASMIALTGALAIAKHGASDSHQMPDEETFFYVAGERGDGLTKSTFGGDVEINGTLVAPELQLEERLMVPELWSNERINVIAPEIGLDAGLVVVGESTGPGYAVYQDILFKNATDPNEIVEIFYENGQSISATVEQGDIVIVLDEGLTTAADILAAIKASEEAMALVNVELKPGSDSAALQSVDGSGTVKVATVPSKATQAPADASLYVARGTAVFNEEMAVSGSAVFFDTVELKSSLEVDGNLVQRGTATLESILVVSGTSEFVSGVEMHSSLWVAGDVDVETNANISGSLNVIGESHLTDTVRLYGELYVDGKATFDSELVVSGAVEFVNDLTVGGNLTVNGEITTLNTTNLTVEDAIVGLAFGSNSYNTNGGIAIFSGSSDSDLVIGRVAEDTWGAGKKDTVGGTVATLADMALVKMRASRFEIDGASDYLDVDTDLKVVAAQGIVLDAAADIELNADGGDFLFKDGAQLGLKLSVSGEDVLFQDAGETEIFRLDASADSLLMSSGKKIEFGGDARYIHNDTNDLKVVGGALIKLEAGDDIELKAAGGDFLFKDGTLTAMTFSISGEDALVKNYGGVEIFRLDDSADSLLMASEKKIEFGSATQYIHNNSSNQLITAASGSIILDGGDELHLDAHNGILRLKDAGVEVAHLDFSGADLQIKAAADLVLDADGGQIEFKDGGTAFLKFDMALGAILPATDLTIDLGSQEFRFNNMYTGDLHLQNDRGHWTLIEEENFISFRNNKNGRRYKMIMEDITGTGTYGPGNDGEM